LAEESNLMRRREKREKKRMELSKYLGINAWKSDQVGGVQMILATQPKFIYSEFQGFRS
jgi:hypothetical protein